MRNRLFKGLLAVAMFAMTAGSANAAVLFSDNFNTENGGVAALNFFGFTNWTVTNGTVDLIGNGVFDYLPGNGLYVDLDGSNADAGILTKTNPIPLVAGNYVLSFDLAGNQVAGNEDVLVTIGGNNNPSYASVPFNGIPFSLPFVNFTIPFVISAYDSGVVFSFANSGGDSIGALLDNVSLDGPEDQTPPAAPEPLTLSLLGTGIVGLVARRRRAQA